MSPYLFVLAVAESIRQNSKIEGLKIYGKEHQVSKYADDTTLYIKQKYEYLDECLDTLDEFEQISGLRINVEKTKIIQIWGLRDNRIKSYNNKEIMWTSEFESLGITFKVNGRKDITEINMEKKLIEIEKNYGSLATKKPYSIWQNYSIFKSLMLSKITYIMLSRPSPNSPP